jgi:hypothetical protein
MVDLLKGTQRNPNTRSSLLALRGRQELPPLRPSPRPVTGHAAAQGFVNGSPPSATFVAHSIRRDATSAFLHKRAIFSHGQDV